MNGGANSNITLAEESLVKNLDSDTVSQGFF